MTVIPAISVLYNHWNKCQIDPRDTKIDLVAVDSKLEQEFWDFYSA